MLCSQCSANKWVTCIIYLFWRFIWSINDEYFGYSENSFFVVWKKIQITKFVLWWSILFLSLLCFNFRSFIEVCPYLVSLQNSTLFFFCRSLWQWSLFLINIHLHTVDSEYDFINFRQVIPNQVQVHLLKKDHDHIIKVKIF